MLTLISYPYVLLTVRGAIQRLDPSLVEAARSLGRRWQAFHRVTQPHLRPGTSPAPCSSPFTCCATSAR